MTIEKLGKAILGAAVVTLWGLAPGCVSTVDAYCNRFCICATCSKLERDDCIDEADDAKKAAGERGCLDEYNDLLSCAHSRLKCSDGRVDLGNCDAENATYLECTNGFDVLPGTNTCEVYFERNRTRYEECGGPVSPKLENPIPCPDEDAARYACRIQCVSLMACDCILDTAGDCTPEELKVQSSCFANCN